MSCVRRSRALSATVVVSVLVSALALPCTAAIARPLLAEPGTLPSVYRVAVPVPGSPAQVAMVQRLFGVLGYPLGAERSGNLGVRTRGAISYFQRKYRLPITGYPDAHTVVEMQVVAASLTAHPSAGGQPAQRDLVDRLLPGVPILALGLACALGIALLALTPRGGGPPRRADGH